MCGIETEIDSFLALFNENERNGSKVGPERERERVVKSKDCPKIGRGQLGRSVTRSFVFLCGIYQQKYCTLLSSGVCKSVCVCFKYLCKFVFVKSCDNTGFAYFWYFCAVFFRNFLIICCIYICSFKCLFFHQCRVWYISHIFVCLVFCLVFLCPVLINVSFSFSFTILSS